MKRHQKGFSLIELLIVVLIIGIVSAIAIPNLLAARRTANEGSAVSALRTIHGAQMTYFTSVGDGNFAGTDSTVGDIAGLNSLRSAGLIDEALATGNRNGYKFVGGVGLADNGNPATFYFSANPAVISGIPRTGSRRFCINQRGAIGYDTLNLGTAFDATTTVSAAPLNQ